MSKPEPVGLEFPLPEPPAIGDTLEVVPGVGWLRMPLPFALDHINLWLLEDGADWAIVDTGYAGDETRAAWRQVLGGRRPGRVICTHYHPDHVGLAAWLEEHYGARLWMSEAEFLSAHALYHRVAAWDGDGLTELFRAHGLDAPRLEALAARRRTYRSGVPALPRSFRRMVDGDRLRIGGRDWRVIVGRGHSPEHCTLYSEELGVLIAGDQVLPRISSNVSVWPTEPEGDPLARFLESLGRFRALPDDTLVLPAHGLPFRGLHARLEALAAHHEERLEQIHQACAVPQTATELLPVLFRRELDAQQVLFGLGESIAHLHYLMYRGRVRREAGADGCWRFVQS